MADTTQTAIEIPDVPSQPTELEDCAAAVFQASGHFVERNVIENALLARRGMAEQIVRARGHATPASQSAALGGPCREFS